MMLHGCCHNPNGIDYTPAEWTAIAEAFAASGTFRSIDTAYQGLGRGLVGRAAGMRAVARRRSRSFVRL